MDGFNCRLHTSVRRQTILDLTQLDFVERRENLVLLSPPAVGKTHLAIALGVEAVNAGYTVMFSTLHDLTDRLYKALADDTVTQTMNRILRHELIILDELGFVELGQTGLDFLFQVVAKAYEKRKRQTSRTF